MEKSIYLYWYPLNFEILKWRLFRFQDFFWKTIMIKISVTLYGEMFQSPGRTNMSRQKVRAPEP